MFAILLSLVLLATPIPLTSRLKAPEARTDALKLLISGELDIPAAQVRPLEKALVALLENPNVEFADQVYAVRALGMHKLGITRLLELSHNDSGAATTRALSIESARALTRFAPPQSLLPLLGHQKPDIRATVARIGGPVPILCAMVRNDPWSMVRAAAIFGLSAGTGGFDCIREGLQDKKEIVQQASIEVLGESSGLLSGHVRAQAISMLKEIVKNRRASSSSRDRAMTALGKLGDCTAARSALRVYLKSGGLRHLLYASIGALQRCDELAPFLGEMIENKNDQVVILGLRALMKQNPKLACRAINTRSSGFRSRRTEFVDAFQAECLNQRPLKDRHIK